MNVSFWIIEIALSISGSGEPDVIVEDIGWPSVLIGSPLIESVSENTISNSSILAILVSN